MSASVLYISYDGLMEPLGQSQVLQYLKLLARQHSVTLLTYEKPEDLIDSERLAVLKVEVKQSNIDWRPLTYHKRPSAFATAYDIAVGLLLGTWLVVTKHIHIVHARSYVPSVMALFLKRFLGVKFLFDMRGFWADERIDGGIWPNGSGLYRVAKWFERRFFLSADTVVSLTHAGVREIERFSYLQGCMPHVVVIPTCTNLDLFNLCSVVDTKGSHPFTLGYVGSVGTWYLLDEMLLCFKELLDILPDARMTFINRHEHDFIRGRAMDLGIAVEKLEVRAAHHSQVAGEMHLMDAGILLIKPVFSKKASAPTKLGEFLACGIPCLSNAGIGDVEAVLEGEGVGVILKGFDAVSRREAMERLVLMAKAPETTRMCRSICSRNFSLEDGVRSYESIYLKLRR